MHTSSKRRCSLLRRILRRPQAQAQAQAQTQSQTLSRNEAQRENATTAHTYSLLPSLRPRALTNGNSHDDTQSQSSLLRLPPEIRQLIWQHAIGGHLLHIARAKDRLFAISCTQPYGAERNTRHHGCWDLTFDMDRWEPTLYGGHVKPLGILAPAQTCRLVYSEVMPILYGDNIFDVNHPETVTALGKTVLPRRLEQVRSLNFSWDNLKYGALGPPVDMANWKQACTTLETRFTGLRELTVHLVNGCGDELTDGGRHSLRCVEELEPLRGVVAARFDVYFYCWHDTCAASVRERPFPFRLSPDEDTPEPDETANPYSFAYRRSLKRNST